LIALAAQIPVFGVAMLTVFSQRKESSNAGAARTEPSRAREPRIRRLSRSVEREGAAPPARPTPEVAAASQAELEPQIEPETAAYDRIANPRRSSSNRPRIETPAEPIAEVEP